MVSYNEYKLCLNNPRLDMKRKNYKYNVHEGIIRKGAKWICSMNKAFHSRFFICICVLLHMMVFGVCIYKVEGSVHVTEPNSSSSRSLYENKGVTYESNVEVHDNFLNKLYMSPNVENNGIKEDNVFGNTDLGGMESHEKFKEKIRRSSTLSQGNYSNFKDGFGYEYSELADSMTDEEIDKEVDKLMEYTNNNKEKVYSLWWQIMRNERVKYVMIMKNLYNFFLKLKKKYNVDNSFSEKQWNICKKRVKKNRLNYEKSINTTFLNWCNSLLLRKDYYRKLIKANRLKWKELSIKTEKACRHNMLQAFEEKVKAQSTKLDLDYVTEHIRKNKKKKKITKDGDGCYSTGPNGQYNECMKTSDYIDAQDSDALVEDEVTEEENISDESVKKEEEEEEEEEKGVDVAEDEDALKDSTASGDSSTSRYTVLSADSAEYMESDILSVLDVPDVNGPASARSVYVQAYTSKPKEMLYRPKIRYVTI